MNQERDVKVDRLISAIQRRHRSLFRFKIGLVIALFLGAGLLVSSVVSSWLPWFAWIIFFLTIASAVVSFWYFDRFTALSRSEAALELDNFYETKERFTTCDELSAADDSRGKLVKKQLLTVMGDREPVPTDVIPLGWEKRHSILTILNLLVWATLLALLLVVSPKRVVSVIRGETPLTKILEEKNPEVREQINEILEKHEDLPPAVKEQLSALEEVLSENDLSSEAVADAVASTEEALAEARAQEQNQDQRESLDSSSPTPTPTPTPEDSSNTPTPTPSPADPGAQPEKSDTGDQEGERKEKEQGNSGTSEQQKQEESDKQSGSQKSDKAKEDESGQESDKKEGEGDGEGQGSGSEKGQAGEQSQKNNGSGGAAGSPENQQQEQGESEDKEQSSQGGKGSKEGERDQQGDQSGAKEAQSENSEGSDSGPRSESGDQSGEQQSSQGSAQAGMKQAEELMESLKQQQEKSKQEGEGQKESSSESEQNQQKESANSSGQGESGEQQSSEDSKPEEGKEGEQGSESDQSEQSEQQQATKESDSSPTKESKNSNQGESMKSQPQPDSSAQRYFEEGEGPEGDPFAGTQNFKEQQIKNPEENLDTRYTESTGQVVQHKGGLSARTEIEDLELAKPDPVEGVQKQKIPLEYADILK